MSLAPDGFRRSLAIDSYTDLGRLCTSDPTCLSLIVVEDWFNTYLGYLQCVFRCTNVRSILGHIEVLMDDGVHVRTS